jgi:hypothetical protein
MRPIRVAVYGDMNLNIIDGSAIWLTSLVEVLLQGPRVQVTLLLKAPEQRDVLTRPLHDLPRLTLVPTPSSPSIASSHSTSSWCAASRSVARRSPVRSWRGACGPT